MRLRARFILVICTALGGFAVLLLHQQRSADMVRHLKGLRNPEPDIISAEIFRRDPSVRTGNPLIDSYGFNNPLGAGENGRGVLAAQNEELKNKEIFDKYQVNNLLSDGIALNRMVPDTRSPLCKNATFEDILPTASVLIPFYNEWPSVLLRTVYSIINRTPRHLLHEIILMDDNSDLEALKHSLSEYVEKHFPRGLVRLVRLSQRAGLIRARQKGLKMATGDVLVIFDSHMEVYTDWLQPLLSEIKKDRKTMALSTLDYIEAATFKYTWRDDCLTRYGFDWRLVFFETFFRQDQYAAGLHTPKLGTVTVGTAYAMDRAFLDEIGGYDDGMKVWGGENLELSWRVWMCGGRLVHLTCSRVGHIARPQPYKFSEGRRRTEVFNYKRAIEIWMDAELKKFVYNAYPEMKDLNVGDLSERRALRQKLKCKNFTWYIENIWPELNIYDKDAQAWGYVKNNKSQKCLDNHGHLFQIAASLNIEQCNEQYATQGFTLKTDGRLRSTLQCVVATGKEAGTKPQLEGCIKRPEDKWTHVKDGVLKHVNSGLCMSAGELGLLMTKCIPEDQSQRWIFSNYIN